MCFILSSEADSKNGNHLADILTKTCFVFGNEGLYKQFVDGAKKFRATKSQQDVVNEILRQVKKNSNNFSTRFCLTKLKFQDKINIKQGLSSSAKSLVQLGRLSRAKIK